MKILFTSAFVLLCASTASHATIVNGFFDDGLNGYDARAEASSAVDNPPSVAPFINVQSNGGNPYAQLLTPESVLSPVLFLTLEQTFTVTSSTSLLSFDFGLVSDTANPDLGSVPGGFIPSTNVDTFTVAIRDLNAPGNILDLGLFTLFEVTTAAPVANPTSSNVTSPGLSPSSNAVHVTSTAASDPFFDTSATVDLTDLIGRDVALEFFVRDFFDGRRTAYAVDNIALSSAQSPSVVPLPASLWLLLAGFGALGLARRRA